MSEVIKVNYSKEGIKKRQEQLNARGPKWSRKILLLLVEAFFVCLIGGGIIVAALGIGVFKSIIATAPDSSKINVTPLGRSSFVYDADGNVGAAKINSNPVHRFLLSLSIKLFSAFHYIFFVEFRQGLFDKMQKNLHFRKTACNIGCFPL